MGNLISYTEIFIKFHDIFEIWNVQPINKIFGVFLQ